MKEVYEGNPSLGDPLTITGQLKDSCAAIDILTKDRDRYQAMLDNPDPAAPSPTPPTRLNHHNSTISSITTTSNNSQNGGGQNTSSPRSSLASQRTSFSEESISRSASSSSLCTTTTATLAPPAPPLPIPASSSTSSSSSTCSSGGTRSLKPPTIGSGVHPSAPISSNTALGRPPSSNTIIPPGLVGVTHLALITTNTF